MEIIQKEHILSNLGELIRNTEMDCLFLVNLLSKGALSECDVAELDSISNRMDKSRKFYQIILTKSDFYAVLCGALQEAKKSVALQILKRLEFHRPEVPLPELAERTRKRVRFNIRSPVQIFTGREQELITMHQFLTSQSNKATVVSQLASITGLGGIGKTELCRKYLEIYSQEYDGNAIWIEAERPEEMKNIFKILAKDYLKLSLKDVDGGEKSIERIVDEVYQYFTDKKVIFVFDNAVGSDCPQLDKYLPFRISGVAPSILITSRDKEWDFPVKVLALDEMTSEDAFKFVKNGLYSEDKTQDEMIIRLILKLQRYPLALTQAIAFIKQQRRIRKFEISHYLDIYEKNAEKLLGTNLPAKGIRFNNYEHNTFTTWKVTTDIILADKENGYVAMYLLKLMAYLAPDKVSVELLSKLPNIDLEDLYSALQLLVRYSMISSQPEENSLSIHRLVQQVTRIELKQKQKDVDTLRECFKIIYPVEDYRHINHAKYLCIYLQEHEELRGEFNDLVQSIKRQIVPFIDLMPELASRVEVSMKTNEMASHSTKLTLKGPMKLTNVSYNAQDGRLFTDKVEITDREEQDS